MYSRIDLKLKVDIDFHCPLIPLLRILLQDIEKSLSVRQFIILDTFFNRKFKSYVEFEWYGILLFFISYQRIFLKFFSYWKGNGTIILVFISIHNEIDLKKL